MRVRCMPLLDFAVRINRSMTQDSLFPAVSIRRTIVIMPGVIPRLLVLHPREPSARSRITGRPEHLEGDYSAEGG